MIALFSSISVSPEERDALAHDRPCVRDQAYRSLGGERRAVRQQLPIKRGRLSGDGAGCPCGVEIGRRVRLPFGLWGSFEVAALLPALDARLQVAEVDFALQQRADGVEDAGAEETEDDVTDVKADPGGDEQNPSRARNCLRFIS